MEKFLEKCEEARKYAFSMSDPIIIHHHDADGITSGSIIINAFKSRNKTYHSRCIKKLDDIAIDELSKEKEVIFVDLGGGNPRVNELKEVLIIDHHQTKDITKFQINPLLFGIDGGTELSSSGTASLVFDEKEDLGVVGAIGDMQSPFKGANRFLLEKAVRKNLIKIENDLCFYGRFSRSILQFLLYSDNPYIPGLSYNESAVISLLSKLGIPMKDGEKWRTYSDLSLEEKRKLVSELATTLINLNQIKKAEDLIGESYVVLTQPKGTEMYEANEFSTLLNACGRHGQGDLGISVCLGVPEAYQKAKEFLRYHRKMIRDGIEFASRNVQDFGKFYFLDARNVIDEGIIGIVCGMYLNPMSEKPIIGVSIGEHNSLKFSSRGTYKLVTKGLNLGNIMRQAAEKVKGIGGGHKIAAGASIPDNKINEFLDEAGFRFLS